MFKKQYLLLSLLILSACATTTEKKEEDTSLKDPVEKSTADQDVKEVDMVYSEGLSLGNKKGRFSCKKYLEMKVEDWKKLVESAQSCIYEKNWDELSNIADILSHNHLKAPWGPYYKSLVASEKFRDYHRAEWMCNLALKKSPNNLTINFQLARIFWKTKRHAEAYDLMKDISKKDSKNAGILRFLGDIEYRDRNFKKALSYYKKIMSPYSSDLNFRAAVATSLFYTGQKKKSVSHYKFLARRSKKKGSYLYQVGEVYKENKKWALAKSYYLKSIKAESVERSIASVGIKKIKIQLDYVNNRIKEEAEKKRKKNEKK